LVIFLVPLSILLDAEIDIKHTFRNNKKIFMKLTVLLIGIFKILSFQNNKI
jgi:hypothetical protein